MLQKGAPPSLFEGVDSPKKFKAWKKHMEQTSLTMKEILDEEFAREDLRIRAGNLEARRAENLGRGGPAPKEKAFTLPEFKFAREELEKLDRRIKHMRKKGEAVPQNMLEDQRLFRNVVKGYRNQSTAAPGSGAGSEEEPPSPRAGAQAQQSLYSKYRDQGLSPEEAIQKVQEELK